MNKEVANLDRREPGNILIPLGHIQHMEFDARALMLIRSFLDLSGVLLSSVLSTALEVEGVSKKARDAIQHALDFVNSREQAVKHLLTTASLQDANLKLICWQARIRDLNLHPRLQVGQTGLPEGHGNSPAQGDCSPRTAA